MEIVFIKGDKMNRKTVLFLINGFGVEKKESYSIYDSSLMPTFEELTKKYLFSKDSIVSTVNNYYDAYRNASLDVSELYNYSILDKDIESKVFLTKENLIEIMKNPNNKTIKQKQEILNSLGIKLELEEDVYEILADKAIKNKTGARGLVGAVDNLFLKAMNEISDSPNSYEELIINKDTVADHHAYKLVKRKK